MFSMNDNVNNTYQSYELRKLRTMNEYVRKVYKKPDDLVCHPKNLGESRNFFQIKVQFRNNGDNGS